MRPEPLGLLGLLFLFACSGGGGSAENLSQSALEVWNFVGGKVIKMVEEFPEDKYAFRPTPEQRTFPEQVLHLISVQDRYREMAGGSPSPRPEAEGITREKLLAATKDSVEAGARLIEEEGGKGMLEKGDLWVEAINHSSEHYGQLVFYFRLNGLVPPISRPGSGQR